MANVGIYDYGTVNGYLFAQTIKNISAGSHTLTLKWRCNGGSTAAEAYYSRTNPAFVSFTAQEIMK